MNICILQGTTVGETRVRELPSGQWAVSFDMRTPANSPSRSIPIEWTGPEKSMPKVGENVPVAVIGVIDRRFYRSGGSIQTQVFVRPEKIVVKQAKRQAALLRGTLEDAMLEVA